MIPDRSENADGGNWKHIRACQFTRQPGLRESPGRCERCVGRRCRPTEMETQEQMANWRACSEEQSRMLCPYKKEGPFGELLEQSSWDTIWGGA